MFSRLRKCDNFSEFAKTRYQQTSWFLQRQIFICRKNDEVFISFLVTKPCKKRTSDSSAEPTANFGGGGLSFTNYEPTVHIGHKRRDLSPPTLPNQRIEKS